MSRRAPPEDSTPRGVVATLSGRQVLQGVDLQVPAGRITGLLAPSGAGKSTLLRTLVRLVEIDAGTITLDGADIATLDARALRRRVGLARALTREPELLLLDEPTSALDHDTAEHIGTTLRRLRDRGLGICLATHDLEFAAAWVDRRVVLA